MKTIFVAAFVAASLAAAPASAEPRPISVGHADLDLATAEGRAKLDLRLLHAARDACGIPSPADLRGRSKQKACVAETLAAAAAQRDFALASARSRAPEALASSR